MNKKDYIKAVDNITAPQELLDRIEALDPPKKKKAPVWKTVTAVAACFVAVIIAFSGIMGSTLKAESEDSLNLKVENGYNYYSDDSLEDAVADGGSFTTQSTGGTGSSSVNTSAKAPNRKIVKTASISIRTKNYDTFITALNQKIEQCGGYIEQSQEHNYDNASNRFANMDVRIPAENLDKFIEELAVIGTITSKAITSDDITDSYIDVESRINALETEEKTLLGILEKAENLSDVIELQDRLSQVRADLESLKAQKQSYDGMISYSGVSLEINEVERVVESDDTFLGEVKEKLMNNLYDLGDFFRELAINLIAALPYIAIIGVVAGVVIVIVKKVRRR
ncbi:MAG: DUF4349 domain-containing protein [Clostridia bacterium]|nr:DUF4349 domain-containing protein [Clostridia bacterium]